MLTESGNSSSDDNANEKVEIGNAVARGSESDPASIPSGGAGASLGSSSSSASNNANLFHRHITFNHTTLNSLENEGLDSPLYGGSFNVPIGVAINSSDDDHLFVSGSNIGRENGVGAFGGESSRNSNNNNNISSQNSSNNNTNTSNSAKKSTFRLSLGIFILIIVDVIWVASSEISFYLFHDEKFDKPFFSTYVKTSMFLIFLFGFMCWSPWYEQCQKADTYTYTLLAAEANSIANIAQVEASDETVDDTASDAALSPPAFVPINYESAGSGNESDDAAHQRSVRFSKLAEVRHLSEHEAAEAFYARLSYQASVQAEQIAYRLANRLSPSQTAHLAVTFCLMWFVANYTYQLAVSHTEVGIVNVLSSSSSLFTLLLAALFPAIAADKFTSSKLISVLVSICGVGVVSFTDLKHEASNIPVGSIFAIVSAFFYAAYLVFLRKRVEHEDKLDIPLFFGFVGLFNLLLLWPLFFVFNYTGIESFEWPNRRQWVFLIVNGIIGTVFSEVLWLWGCFLTSSLIATLAISLTIPMTMIADVIFKKVSYSWLFYIGSVPMFLSFFAVTLLTHHENWDPVGVLWNRMCKKCWPYGRTTRYQRVLHNDNSEQQERLLEDDDLEDEEDRDEESRFGVGSENNERNVSASAASA